MRSDVKKIGIIGAGVGGLIAAKTLLEEGFDCEVLESKGSLGGVWDNGYHSLRLQLPKESYEFLDWPMPASYPNYPSCDQIVSYLNLYARHFRVFKRIQFNRRVDKLEHQPDEKGWTLRCHDTKRNVEYEKAYDLVVVCNGLYSSPRTPVFPNQDQFKGRIIHSSLFQDPELAQDSKVVVVGFGKSALDRAEDAAQRAEQVTLVFRQAHWPVPPGEIFAKLLSRHFPGALSIASLGREDFCVLLADDKSFNVAETTDRICTEARDLIYPDTRYDTFTPIAGCIEYDPDKYDSFVDMLHEADELFFNREIHSSLDFGQQDRTRETLDRWRKTIF